MESTVIRGLNEFAPAAIDDATFFPEGVRRLAIRFYPDQALFVKCKPVTYGPHVKALAQNMLLSMVASNGMGLAANQVGLDLRIFVADVEWHEQGGLENSKSYVFINPAIVSKSAEVVRSVEGCLSFPGENHEVIRAKSIVVHALDINGEPFTLEADGVLALVIQHEYEHLEGHTFIDRKGYLTRQQARKNVAKILKRRGLR